MTALLDSDADGRPAVTARLPAPDVDSDGAGGPLELLARIAGPLPDQIRWAAGFPSRLTERAMRSAGEQWPGLRETVVEVTQRTPGLSMLASLMPMGRRPARSSTSTRPVGRHG